MDVSLQLLPEQPLGNELPSLLDDVVNDDAIMTTGGQHGS
jgi:hypothetical protein